MGPAASGSIPSLLYGVPLLVLGILAWALAERRTDAQDARPLAESPPSTPTRRELEEPGPLLPVPRVAGRAADGDASESALAPPPDGGLSVHLLSRAEPSLAAPRAS